MTFYVTTLVAIHATNALVGMVTDETLWDRLSSMTCLLLALWLLTFWWKGVPHEWH